MKKKKYSHSFTFMLAAVTLLLVYLFVRNGDILDIWSESPDDGLTVRFIDVGQGDCELIRLGDIAILIDAGEAAAQRKVVSELRSAGVTTLDYVIATHPHSDHIGGMADVIDAFAVRHVMMPKATTNTTTFEKLLQAIQNKGLKIEAPPVGRDLTVGDIRLSFYAPNSESYDDLNNTSIVCKLVYGQTSFLFTGDAEGLSEKEMLDKGYDLTADVLKVGHHGSNSSTSERFLAAVQPEMAVISCAVNNDYGHPHQAILDRLEQNGVTVYRTDERGTVIMVSDGKSIKIK